MDISWTVIVMVCIFDQCIYFTTRPGPCCSKLMMSLFNISLKFQTLISNIRQYFFVEKCSAKASLIFSTENVSVFGYKVVQHLTS